MIDEPRAGEWATVVQEHCAASGNIGNVVNVTEIEPPHPLMNLRCPACKMAYSFNEAHALILGHKTYHPLHWLRRLPPPSDVIEHDERELEVVA